MSRMDQGLAFMLQYENIAWYENGKVRILDRRIYPREVKFVECSDYHEVRQAITDMVTQSAGPYTAAGMGMALAAYQAEGLSKEKQIAFLKEASDVISHARPTTVNRMKLITESCYEVGKEAIEQGKSAVEAIFQRTVDSLERRYGRMSEVAKNLVKLFPQKGKVMTQCFGETIVGCMGREIRNLTIGVIGTGKIGGTVIKSLAGFQCKILANSEYGSDEIKKYAQYVSMETLYKESDVISLHVPLTDESYHMINEETIDKMKDGVILINAARGELMDIQALIKGIEDQKIGALGLDVIENENGIYHMDRKSDIIQNRDMAYLRQFPNVVLTQHMAFYTDSATESMVRCGVEGLVGER